MKTLKLPSELVVEIPFRQMIDLLDMNFSLASRAVAKKAASYIRFGKYPEEYINKLEILEISEWGNSLRVEFCSDLEIMHTEVFHPEY